MQALHRNQPARIQQHTIQISIPHVQATSSSNVLPNKNIAAEFNNYIYSTLSEIQKSWKLKYGKRRIYDNSELAVGCVHCQRDTNTLHLVCSVVYKSKWHSQQILQWQQLKGLGVFSTNHRPMFPNITVDQHPIHENPNHQVRDPSGYTGQPSLQKHTLLSDSQGLHGALNNIRFEITCGVPVDWRLCNFNNVTLYSPQRSLAPKISPVNCTQPNGCMVKPVPLHPLSDSLPDAY
ncbi:hypothetical protein Anapl_12259 [Anas platyrhynchos]|uniref:Uncharacterized protein n=1 Tax=Anas platyrhynchos TaxID=8839 RepID=R0JR02_ANAPL|nr:hypothetical protein Anapl_12259 [Anas platyrhynchos]